MTRLRNLAVAFTLVVPLSFVAGCKQGIGDRCQVTSDCNDGLICVLPAGGTPQAGGTCQPAAGTADGGLGDMSATATDMTKTGGSTDMATGGGTD
jgi:hypothetical protein